MTRAELEGLILDGFFPDCMSTDRPRRALGAINAIKEWGLPYAFDGAITRHLAAFLHDRPSVDAVLFNGGSLGPLACDKLREQIGRWQEGRLLAGSFERIGHELKAELIGRFIESAVELASRHKHYVPYLAALGLINRRRCRSRPASSYDCSRDP